MANVGFYGATRTTLSQNVYLFVSLSVCHDPVSRQNGLNVSSTRNSHEQWLCIHMRWLLCRSTSKPMQLLSTQCSALVEVKVKCLVRRDTERQLMQVRGLTRVTPELVDRRSPERDWDAMGCRDVSRERELVLLNCWWNVIYCRTHELSRSPFSRHITLVLFVQRC